MKTINLLLVIVATIVLGSCEKEEQSEQSFELTFSKLNYEIYNSSYTIGDVIDEYNEILAYDSAKHVFELEAKVWKEIDDKVIPRYPDPGCGFGVILYDELVYKGSVQESG